MKNKNQKGITLIALVITIIVLIILAGISINMLFGDNGIINKAQEAGKAYEEATNREMGQLDQINDYLSTFSGWTYNHENQTVTRDNITLNIGDYISYTAPESSGYDGNWRLLGTDDQGHLLLVPAEKSIEKMTINIGPLYLSAITDLNSACQKYLNNSVALSARNIIIEDIDKITGYNPRNVGVNDPTKQGEGTIFEAGNIAEYGNQVKYTYYDIVPGYDSQGVETTYKNSSTGETVGSGKLGYQFILPGESTNITTPYTVTANVYQYNPITLSTTAGSSPVVGISQSSQAWDMLFSGTSNDDNCYWLANKQIIPANGKVYFTVCLILNEIVQGAAVVDTNGGYGGYIANIRPVITLKNSITPVKLDI